MIGLGSGNWAFIYDQDADSLLGRVILQANLQILHKIL